MSNFALFGSERLLLPGALRRHSHPLPAAPQPTPSPPTLGDFYREQVRTASPSLPFSLRVRSDLSLSLPAAAALHTSLLHRCVRLASAPLALDLPDLRHRRVTRHIVRIAAIRLIRLRLRAVARVQRLLQPAAAAFDRFTDTLELDTSEDPVSRMEQFHDEFSRYKQRQARRQAARKRAASSAVISPLPDGVSRLKYDAELAAWRARTFPRADDDPLAASIDSIIFSADVDNQHGVVVLHTHDSLDIVQLLRYQSLTDDDDSLDDASLLDNADSFIHPEDTDLVRVLSDDDIRPIPSPIQVPSPSNSHKRAFSLDDDRLRSSKTASFLDTGHVVVDMQMRALLQQMRLHVGSQSRPSTATTTPLSSPYPTEGEPSPVHESDIAAAHLHAEDASIELERQIGSGGFSTVYLGYLPASHPDFDPDVAPHLQRVAVKQLLLASSSNQESLERLLALEVHVLRRCNHPNIVRYRGLYKQPFRLDALPYRHVQAAEQVDSPMVYNILMDYVPGGSLRQLIRSHGRLGLPEAYAAGVTKQVLDGLAYLHSNQIIHRDIKPDNLLVEWPVGHDSPEARVATVPHVLISDFGVAKLVCEGSERKHSCLGTPWYLSPEVIRMESYSFEADIYSVGCCVYHMVVGHAPYAHLKLPAQVILQVAKHGPPPLDTLPPHVSAQCRDFLTKCWLADWQQRPSAVELCSHPFVSQPAHPQ